MHINSRKRAVLAASLFKRDKTRKKTHLVSSHDEQINNGKRKQAFKSYLSPLLSELSQGLGMLQRSRAGCSWKAAPLSPPAHQLLPHWHTCGSYRRSLGGGPRCATARHPIPPYAISSPTGWQTSRWAFAAHGL